MPELGLLEMFLLKFFMLLEESSKTLLLSDDLGLMLTDFFVGLLLLSFDLLFDLSHMFWRNPTLFIKRVFNYHCDG